MENKAYPFLELEYLRVAKQNFNSIKAYADKTIAQLNNDEINFQAESESNSIAILMQHIAGNLNSRFTDFLTSDGEKANRNRDKEFEKSNLTKTELIIIWENAWKILFDLLNRLTIADFQVRTVYIRKEAHTILEAINRQVWHYSFHVGQIVYIGKQIKNNNWKNLSIEKGKSEEFNAK